MKPFPKRIFPIFLSFRIRQRTKESYVVWVDVGGDKTPAPVYSTAELGETLLPQLGKLVQPIFGIGELVNLLAGDA